VNYVIAKSALKTLRSVQPKTAAAMLALIKSIAADPFGEHPTPNACGVETTSSAFDSEIGESSTDWIVFPTPCS